MEIKSPTAPAAPVIKANGTEPICRWYNRANSIILNPTTVRALGLDVPPTLLV